MEQLTYLKNVVTLALNPEKCVGCGMCLVVCPHAVFQMNHRCVEINSRDRCMECGACEKNCPAGALSVQAGVGCAQAVINSVFSRNSDNCCCVIDPQQEKSIQAGTSVTGVTRGCC